MQPNRQLRRTNYLNCEYLKAVAKTFSCQSVKKKLSKFWQTSIYFKDDTTLRIMTVNITNKSQHNSKKLTPSISVISHVHESTLLKIRHLWKLKTLIWIRATLLAIKKNKLSELRMFENGGKNIFLSNCHEKLSKIWQTSIYFKDATTLRITTVNMTNESQHNSKK